MNTPTNIRHCRTASVPAQFGSADLVFIASRFGTAVLTDDRDRANALEADGYTISEFGNLERDPPMPVWGLAIVAAPVCAMFAAVAWIAS